MKAIITEVECRSILNKSGIPGIDYALNPYVGCEHACVYCYADFMRRFTGHREPWGSFVDVKVNAPEVLRRQLRRLPRGLISFGTVTDPYQPAEARYKITRGCLEGLIGQGFPVSILTKSALILRDLDLLKALEGLEVGFTVTVLDERVRRAFEPYSSPSLARLEALKRLAEAGIKTWLFFGPVLPYFSDSWEHIDELFASAAEAGVNYLLVDRLNLYPQVWGRVRWLLKRSFPEALPAYEEYQRNSAIWCEELRAKAEEAAKGHRVSLRFAF
jgi:DNA repair photolyase